jgi:hypothetical protein
VKYLCMAYEQESVLNALSASDWSARRAGTNA